MIKFRYALFLFLLCNFNLTSFAQKRKIDSLTTLLRTPQKICPKPCLEDTTRIKALNALSWELMYSNPDTAIILTNQALVLCEPLSNSLRAEIENFKVQSYGNLGVFYFMKIDYHTASTYYLKALKIAEEIGDKRKIARVLGLISTVYDRQSDYPKALDYLFRALKINEEFGLKPHVANNLSSIGGIYRLQGDYPKAMEYQVKALKMNEELGVKIGIANSSMQIGVISYAQSDYPQALEYYSKALKMYEELNIKKGTASTLSAIGAVYGIKKNYSSALDHFFQALKIYEELKDKNGMAVNYGNIGINYLDQKEYLKALDFCFKALKINEELSWKIGTTINLFSIGSIYTKIGKFKEAEECLKRSLVISDSIAALDETKTGHLYLSQLYDTLATLPSSKYHSKEEALSLSFFHYKKYIAARDSLFNEENTKKTLRTQIQYDYDKKEFIAQAEFDKKQALSAAELEKRKILLMKNKQDLLLLGQENELKELSITKSSAVLKQKEAEAGNQQKAIELLNKDKQLKEIEAEQKEEVLKQQKLLTYSSSGGGILVLGFLFIAIRGYRQKKKAHVLISSQKLIVEKQKHEVEKQKELVEEKQKEILDSITYAKRLQEAILPPVKLVKEHLPESFILYQPKDIVAGDFYWMEVSTAPDQIKTHDDIPQRIILIAAADCTGHGVPGAMVSVVCSNALNRAVKEFGITEPGKILDKVRELVIETFEKSESEVKDGMDISLCALNTATGELKWAGANNPIWIINDTELLEIKADKQPIGKYAENKPFTTHSLQLSKNAALYIFTDGLADQFGGEQGKKFKSANFKKLLLSIQNESMQKQHEIISETFHSWKGDIEQVDDVCVIGIKI